MKKSLFIVLDGTDGAGKSTQIQKLKRYFGDKVVTTREPGGCLEAEEIRQYIFDHPHLSAKEQFDLVWKARKLHLEQTIKPALNAGKMVITDRFDSSTWVYQICEGESPELIKAFWDIRKTVLSDTEPDCYIYLRVDSKIGMSRKTDQKDVNLNYFDTVKIEILEKRRESFKTFFDQLPSAKIKIVDANKSENEVFQEILDILTKL